MTHLHEYKAYEICSLSSSPSGLEIIKLSRVGVDHPLFRMQFDLRLRAIDNDNHALARLGPSWAPSPLRHRVRACTMIICKGSRVRSRVVARNLFAI